MDAQFKQQRVQQLPGGAGERLAGVIVGGAGCFSDQHQAGVGVAMPEDDLGASISPSAGDAAIGGEPGGFERWVQREFHHQRSFLSASLLRRRCWWKSVWRCCRCVKTSTI